MKFALSSELIDEARRFNLKYACRDCFYWTRGACAHEWPQIGQDRVPLDAPNDDGTLPTEAVFCKEFELR